ncbi:hypothetical protein FEM48_Zijuj01G0020400 [Ziziphus jujuba var. spinosa]|uniref:Sodium transporter HKT1-like n=1 Tax=Ziziphus jujuba var. spinosa TaxID=714518 RepID=A0A978VYH6_ZIZJJ|nr:hypothetical protein FEM48_Zijuj01G0020400 [Ziziphus jujuba var. spinosa]
MIVFKKNFGLLLILILQVLLGNTLYPSCLRFLIWVLWKTTKRTKFNYMLRNYKEMGYSSLLSGVHSSLLAVTMFSFMLVQFVLFCALEWNSEIMDGLNPYQKFMASLFEITNSRRTSESVFDLSTITPPILVLVVLMIAYGNVGFSTGYSCERQLEPKCVCIDKWYGFVGRWSAKGKSILILVMFFGRLKKFTLQGGKAWVLS